MPSATLPSTSFRSALKDKGVRWIAVGWACFITENLVFSHNRGFIIENFSDQAYHIFYSLSSTLACSTIAYGNYKYGSIEGAPKLLHKIQPAKNIVAFVFASMGCIGFAHLLPRLQIPVTLSNTNILEAPQPLDQTQTQTQNVPNNNSTSIGMKKPTSVSKWEFKPQCPIDFKAKDEPQGDDIVYGIRRITRHTTFWSLGLLGASFALTTPYVSKMVLCGMFPVFALIGGSHQDYRYRRGSGGKLSPELDSISSNIPFVALVTGKQKWGDLLSEMKYTNAMLATLLAMGIMKRRIAGLRKLV